MMVHPLPGSVMLAPIDVGLDASLEILRAAYALNAKSSRAIDNGHIIA